MSADLPDLVQLAKDLGAPERGLCAARIGTVAARDQLPDAMWMQASGAAMHDASTESFVRTRRSRILAMLDAKPLPAARLREGLGDATVDQEVTARPAGDAFLHAVCFEFETVRFVARTHPTAVNAILCSNSATDLAATRVTPEQISSCGPQILTVPFETPMVALAQALRTRLRDFVAEHDCPPKVIWLQNQGMLALGATAREALDATLGAVEAARILAATMPFGGPRPIDT